MADLRSLMQMAPNTGAFFTGQQIAQDQQADDLKNAELAQIIAKRKQDYDFATQNNPLLLEKQRLANTGQGLTNTSTDLANQKTQGTLASDIGATNAKNNAEITAKHIEEANKTAEFMANAALRFGNIENPTARTYEMAKYAKQSGFDLQDQGVQQLLQMEPQQLIKASQAIAQHTAKNSPAYIQAIEQANIQRDSHLRGISAQNQTQLELEDKRIEAGKYASKRAILSLEQQIDSARSARERHQKLIDAATIARQNKDEDAYQNYMARAEAVRPQAEAEIKAATPGGVDVGAVTNLPTTAGPQIAPPGTPTPQPAAPQAPNAATAPVADPKVMNAAKQAFGSYEPDKYEYGINPATGKFARRPKKVK